jgi:hypothetical protein
MRELYPATIKQNRETVVLNLNRSVEGLTEMIAVGLCLPSGTFKEAGEYG